ncbi:hypothetical protein P8452_45182 [Trifolium repens]|nr:hypothetical protein P8452_45182 [Trifolium repens]
MRTYAKILQHRKIARAGVTGQHRSANLNSCQHLHLCRVKLNDYLAKTDSIVSHPNSMEHMYERNCCKVLSINIPRRGDALK